MQLNKNTYNSNTHNIHVQFKFHVEKRPKFSAIKLANKQAKALSTPATMLKQRSTLLPFLLF